MASLIEELIDVLEEENSEYEKLIDLSKEKTPVIIEGNTTKLRKITAKEQVHTDKIANLESRRISTVKDIGIVLNKDADKLTIKTIIELLKGQEEEQKRLSLIHDKIRRTLKDMVTVNEMNKTLIEESLEMIDFNINLINNFTQQPTVANYSKDAHNVSHQYPQSGFDAKQ